QSDRGGRGRPDDPDRTAAAARARGPSRRLAVCRRAAGYAVCGLTPAASPVARNRAFRFDAGHPYRPHVEKVEGYFGLIVWLDLRHCTATVGALTGWPRAA